MRKPTVTFSLLLAVLLAVAGTFMERRGQAGGDPKLMAETGGEANARPGLASLLKSDGTLDLSRGFRGSLDSRGYRLEYANNGAPRFVPAAPSVAGDEFWDSQFVNANGAQGFGYAVAVIGTDVYLGGSPLLSVGNLQVSNLAKWDGSTWSDVGGGVNGSVYMLLANGTDLYVGGDFTMAGGISANNIAKWNGSSWSALGAGVSGGGSDYVFGLAISGTDLYVGGKFTMAGGVSASNIAKWNGSAWSALGSGTDQQVVAVAVSGSTVYAGGDFSTAGGNSASYIARWNGSIWSALGTGMDLPVHSLTVSGSNLYAGGIFSTAGGISANGIARWNGSAWSALGSGLLNAQGFSSSIRSIVLVGSNLYAAGEIATAGGNPANGIALWNGSTWSALGGGLLNGAFSITGNAFSIAASGSNLYVAGGFTKAGGNEANRIAKWNGSAWSPIGNTSNSVNNPVYAILVSGNDVYVGGEFDFAGGVPANSIVKWNGVSWSALGSGILGRVNALALNGTDLYAGGSFTTAGGVSANNIAKWNGSAWSALGSGIGGEVSTLSVIGTSVYAGGFIFTAGGNPANLIARWNGSAWSTLGSGLTPFITPIQVKTAVIGGDLYVGGNFLDASGVPNTMNLAKWNGSVWSAVGAGVGCPVDALAVQGTDLYIGGRFTTAGGNPANRIAKWNGSTWSALGSGLTGGGQQVNSIAIMNNNIFVGGRFAAAGGNPASNIAKWNGSVWSPLGSGTSDNVAALGIRGTDVIAGGSFVKAGLNTSHFFAQFATNTPPTITAQTGVTTQKGAPASNLQIATVADAESGANGVTVTVNGGASATINGVTVSSIVNSGGTVTANIASTCGATNASFTLTATDTNNAAVTATLNVTVTGISVNPATLVNGLTFIPYTATLSATGGSGSYTFSLVSGSLPAGLMLTGNMISGMPTTAGASTFTIRADDDGNACFGERSYTVNIGSTGLMYYPLARPVRLLDTRNGASPNACSQPNAQIPGGTSFTQAARGTCDGITIPANATTLTGNVTIVQPASNGFLTLYPGDAPKPDVANSNYLAAETLNNAFTVGLGAVDGAFKIFVNSTTHVVIDVTGYYAPPITGGLYFHPLPKPIRLLETRQGFTGCQATGTPLLAGSTRLQTGVTTCDGVMIPTGAQALVGNATTTNSAGNGYLTLYPGDAAQPFIASSNYLAGVNRNAPFTVGLSLNGEFNIFTSATSDLVVDVMGYFSAQATDANGQGLLFNSLGSPLRLLDTRAGQPACYTPGAPMIGGAVYTQDTQIPCTNLTATAGALVGNVSAVNATANGYLTFWPSDATQPTVATSNYQTGRVFNRHFTVGLGPDVAFKRFTSSTTDLIIDISGFFAP